MSWKKLLQIIANLAGQPAADRVESRARAEMGGERVSVPQPGKRAGPLTLAEVQAALLSNGHSVDRAAAALGVHRTSVARVLDRHLAGKRQRAQPAEPGPRYNGRLVR